MTYIPCPPKKIFMHSRKTAAYLLCCFVLISLGCAAATTKISNRGQLYLSISYSNKEAWAKRPFLPQNRYGIILRNKPVEINEPVTLIQIEHDIGGNRMMFRRENGDVHYLAIDAESVEQVGRVLQEHFYLEEPETDVGDAGEEVADFAPGLQNLIVLRDRAPIKVRPDITGETIAQADAGARLAPEITQRSGPLQNWWQVRVDTTAVGWIHEQFVSEPVPAGSFQERTIRSQAIREAGERKRLGDAERARQETERAELEAKINPQWPYEIRNVIRHHNLIEGMNQEMVKLSLGFPDDIIYTSTLTGMDEQWIYQSGRGRYRTVSFKNDEVTGWQN
jgi:hypothetical protein